MAASLGETRAVRRGHGTPVQSLQTAFAASQRRREPSSPDGALAAPADAVYKVKIAQCGCRGGGTALEAHRLVLNPSASIYELGTP